MRTAAAVTSHVILALLAAGAAALAWRTAAEFALSLAAIWIISGSLAAALAAEHTRYALLAGRGIRAPRWFTRGSWLALAGVAAYAAATRLAPVFGFEPNLGVALVAVLAVAVAFVAATFAAVAGLARLDAGARRA
jgi:hypothetical protein